MSTSAFLLTEREWSEEEVVVKSRCKTAVCVLGQCHPVGGGAPHNERANPHSCGCHRRNRKPCCAEQEVESLCVCPLCLQASSSDGALTLDLIQEEDAPSPLEGAVGSDNPRTSSDKPLSQLGPDCPRSNTDGALSSRSSEVSGKSRSLPREAVVVWETPQSGEGLSVAEKNRCASMDHIITHSETDVPKNKVASSPTSCSVPVAGAVSRLQQLIDKKLEETEQLLAGVQGGTEGRGREEESSKGARAEAEKLLQQALLTWSQAQEVLEEVKELRALCRQLDPPLIPQNSTKWDPDPRSLK